MPDCHQHRRRGQARAGEPRRGQARAGEGGSWQSQIEQPGGCLGTEEARLETGTSQLPMEACALFPPTDFFATWKQKTSNAR